MAEQSHLEAMREAIKGDLERARARRPSIFERPAPPPPEMRGAAETPAVEPAPEALAEPELLPEREPEGVPEPEAVPKPEPVPEPSAVEPVREPEPEPPLEAETTTPKRRRFRLRFWRP
jgi:hypothetical protein